MQLLLCVHIMPIIICRFHRKLYKDTRKSNALIYWLSACSSVQGIPLLLEGEGKRENGSAWIQWICDHKGLLECVFTEFRWLTLQLTLLGDPVDVKAEIETLFHYYFARWYFTNWRVWDTHWIFFIVFLSKGNVSKGFHVVCRTLILPIFYWGALIRGCG